MTIKFCGCEHKYQDKKYGKHQRVHNKRAGGSLSSQGTTCTVCGTKKTN